ncbi:MAG: hypothetical protein AABZ20_12165 [candidate division NC10 bacterium]
MNWITVEELALIHERVIAETGGCLRLNGYRLVPSEEAESVFWAIARGEKAVEEIAGWFKAHSEPWQEP